MQLVRGDKLNAAQRKNVLAGFLYRWTTGNADRQQIYGQCPVCNVYGGQPGSKLEGCEQHHPVIELQTESQWLREHAFWVKKNGELDNRGAEPAYMLEHV